MDFDCYTGDRGPIPTHGDSLGKWMNLRPGQPMPCQENWVVSPRCWRDIDLHSVYNCENGLFSLMQFNHIHTYTHKVEAKQQCGGQPYKYYCFLLKNSYARLVVFALYRKPCQPTNCRQKSFSTDICHSVRILSGVEWRH